VVAATGDTIPDTAAVLTAELGGSASGWFTGAALPDVADANLAHHRPHRSSALARARAAVGALTGTDRLAWHLMRQVHGADVGVVDAVTPPGAELRDVDALVTAEPGRVLVVLAADCLPILLAGRRSAAAVHAGWRGLDADVIGRTVAALVALGERPEDLRAVIGPAIHACCYEVGPEVAARMAAIEPTAVLAPTASRRHHVDLAAVAVRRFVDAGVDVPDRCGPCVRCGPGAWFSHRRDPASGRQAGLVRLDPS
jgi:YfiH family protein